MYGALALLFANAALAADEAPQAEAQDGAETKEAEEQGDKFPVSGSAALIYGVTNGTFASSAAADDVNFGLQTLTLGLGVRYAPWDFLSFSVDTGAAKVLDESGFGRGSTSTTTLRRTELADTSVSAGWGGYKVEAADLHLGAGVAAGLPTSRASRAIGLIASVGPNVSLTWSKWGVSVSAIGAYAYSILESPTVQIPEEYRHLIDVSGADLGEALSAHTIQAIGSIGYKIIDGLSISAAYVWTNSYSAIEGPDDEYTSEYAQTGTQAGTGAHGTQFALSYTLKATGTTFAAGMMTMGGVYTNDNKSVRNPLYDTESDISHRTSYSFTLAQSL